MANHSGPKYSIVLVSFPFDDFTGEKVRPALCLTNEIGPYGHLIVAFISSNTESFHLVSDILLEKSTIDFSLTGLRVDSIVRLHRLVTIPSKIVKRTLGNLPLDVQQTVKSKLIELFTE
jgi:mRNA interferase MazF